MGETHWTLSGPDVDLLGWDCISKHETIQSLLVCVCVWGGERERVCNSVHEVCMDMDFCMRVLWRGWGGSLIQVIRPNVCCYWRWQATTNVLQHPVLQVSLPQQQASEFDNSLFEILFYLAQCTNIFHRLISACLRECAFVMRAVPTPHPQQNRCLTSPVVLLQLTIVMIIVLLLFVSSAFLFYFLCFVVAAVSVDQGGLSSLIVFLFLLCCVQNQSCGKVSFLFLLCCVQNQSYAKKKVFVFAVLCCVQNQSYGKGFLFFVVLCLKSVLWKRLFVLLLCCV